MGVIRDIAKDEKAPKPVRLQAAQYIVDQHIGKATQPTADVTPPKDMGPLRELGIEKIRLLIQLMKRYTPEELEKLAGIAERHDQESVGVGKGQSQGE